MKKKQLKLHNLTTPHKQNRKRLGRGTGSGHGKTATAGHKGQRSRSGHKIGATFEGGQMPFYRRIPKKRGFAQPHKKLYQIVNLGQINRLKLTRVDHPILLKHKLITDIKAPVKILAKGKLEFTAHFCVNAFSENAIKQLQLTKSSFEII